MSISTDRTPAWSWAAPAAGVALLGAIGTNLFAEGALALVLAGLLLLATVFAAVHHAELLALRIGEPFGSILLALAVTVIEVALIVSVMLSGGQGADTVARDTVFSAVMISLCGMVGLCLVLGGRRHFEQRFRLEGAAAALAVLGTLAVLALILPNHTVATLGPSYAPPQLLLVGLVSLALYGTFVFVQTVKHRDYFLADDAPGAGLEGAAADRAHPMPPGRVTAASAALLPLSLIVVVLLAKLLSHPLERGVAAAGLPPAVVGVAIAAIVLLPEGLAAAKAALRNRLQDSLNLALGSALASIGLTIPTVAAVSLLLGIPLSLGISAADTVLLVLALFVGALTLGTGRTTVLHGAIHLVIFVIFLLLAAVP